MSGEMICLFEEIVTEIEYAKRIQYGDDEYEFVEKKKYDYSDWSCRIDYKNVRKAHSFRCGMDSTKIKKIMCM